MNAKVHFLHYLLLALILLSGLGIFFLFRWQPERQFWAVVATVLGYVGWGIWHHRVEDRLSVGVVLEYFLVAAVIVCIFGLNLLG